MKVDPIAPVLKRVSAPVAEVSRLVVALLTNEFVITASEDNIQSDLFR